jgi:hypothetical protein
VPAAPGNLVAQRADTPLGGQISVSWTQPADNGAAISGYELTITGGGSTVVRTFDGTATRSYAMLDARNGVAYQFAVRARNRAGWGASATASAATYGAPSTPTGLVASAHIGDGAIEVSWSASDGNGSPVSEYHVRVNGGDPVTVHGTSYTAQNLVGGRQYTFQVQAQNSGQGGSGGYTSDWSATSGPVTAVTKPGPPTNLAIDLTDRNNRGRPGTATVSWDPADAAGGSGLVYVWKLVSRNGDVVGSSPDGGESGTTHSVPLSNAASAYGQQLTLTVYARTNGGSSVADSTFANVKWGDTPGAPSGVELSAVADGDDATTDLKLVWSAPADTGGLDVQGYTVVWYVNGQQRRTGTTDANTYQRSVSVRDLGAQPADVIKATVQATNLRGPGATASSAEVTVQAAAPPSPTDDPTPGG